MILIHFTSMKLKHLKILCMAIFTAFLCAESNNEQSSPIIRWAITSLTLPGRISR